MDYELDEYYYEPGVADAILAEYQDKMKNALLESVKSQIESIKEENAQLKEENKTLRAREREVHNKETILESRKQSLMHEVKKERLSKLMEEFQVIMYKADSDFVKGEKCTKCDENRKISFKSPSGKDYREDCECNVSTHVYLPEEYVLVEFKMDTDKGNMSMWFTQHSEKNYDYYRSDSVYVRAVYNDKMKFEEINKSNTFFRKIEECQLYCDWLNAQTK